jgi:signal transduction histidine kinase
MRMPRVFRTASFKLAALYAVSFAASVIALAGVVYFTATAALDQETRARVRSEAAMLRAEYQLGGLPRMVEAIHDRQRARSTGDLDYSVYGANGRLLFAGNTELARKPGWSEMVGPPDGDEPQGELEHLIVFGSELPKGYWLIVGADIGRVAQLGRAILATFGWVLLLTITLAIGGGIALSAAFLSRIDSITRTAEAIIGGDVHRRIPLRGAADDIDRLAATLNRMLDRIGSLMEALRQVSNDIAHDLRTPLGRLRQTLDEVRRGPGSRADYEVALDRAVGETDAILDTFAALLRIAQIEAGTRQSGFRAVDLSELAEGLSQTYAPVAEDAGKRFEASIAAGIAINGDRELLAQMLANVIENAIHHTPDGATIRVTLQPAAHGPLLTVSDTGPGIAEGERSRVFERFYRLERSRTTAGSGLGLSLVAAIADLHDAKVALSDNNPGLVLVIAFPSHSAGAAAASDNAFGFKAAPTRTDATQPGKRDTTVPAE